MTNLNEIVELLGKCNAKLICECLYNKSYIFFIILLKMLKLCMSKPCMTDIIDCFPMHFSN